MAEKTTQPTSKITPASDHVVEIPALIAGQNLAIASPAGGVLALPDISDATFARQGNDLILEKDGGTVTLLDFFAVDEASSLPDLRLPDGTFVSGADFLEDMNMDISTAAGSASSGRLNPYSDDAGQLFGQDGYDRLGVGGRLGNWANAAENGYEAPDPNIYAELVETSLSIAFDTANTFEEGDGAKSMMTVKVTLDDAPTRPGGTLTLTVTDPAGNPVLDQDGKPIVVTESLRIGQTEYTVLVSHGNYEDVYVDPSNIIVTARIEGGGLAPVSESSDIITITDTDDTTEAKLDLSQEGGDLVVRVDLVNADGLSTAPKAGETTEVTVLVTIDGVDQEVSISIPAGETSGSNRLKGALSSIYDDPFVVSAVVQDFEHTGEQYEKKSGTLASDTAEPVEKPFIPDPVETTITITADDTTTEEGTPFVVFTVEMENPPKPGTTPVLTFTANMPGYDYSGKEYTVEIGPDGKGELKIDNLNVDDVFKDESQLTVTVVKVEGYSDPKLIGKEMNADIADTEDDTTAHLTLEQDGYDLVVKVDLTAKFDPSAQEGETTDVYVKIKIDGVEWDEPVKVTLEDGKPYGEI
ncbi:MAG: hypothetical protein FWF99_00710, partial [Desulfovibrionaceae bacterium]|nr:hypothetical protein [Desulfovibrionaceae bacterium]